MQNAENQILTVINRAAQQAQIVVSAYFRSSVFAGVQLT